MNIEHIIREYLPNVLHLSLATMSDDKPWVCELHYAYDENLNLYFRSKPNRRHSLEIAANPNVAGNIIKQHALEQAVQGVYFEGMALQLSEGPALTKAFACIKERHGTSDDILAEADQPDGHKFYQISVSKYYFFGAVGDEGASKHELIWNTH